MPAQHLDGIARRSEVDRRLDRLAWSHRVGGRAGEHQANMPRIKRRSVSLFGLHTLGI